MDDGSLVGNGSCVWGNQGSTHRISACLFKNIKVRYWGSAIQSFGGNAYIDNCIFTGNKAGEENGTGDGYGTIAFYHADQVATTKRITNCTFVNNRSRFPGSSSGGAIHNRGRTGDDFIVTNCLVYNNGQYPLYSQGPATVWYSFIPSSNYGFTDGGNNFVGEPMFADDYFHLSESSPCINVGLNDPEPFMERDYEGNRRLLNRYMDVGAFEYNRIPGNLSISDTVINENTGAGVSVLSFSATDPDPEDAEDLYFELAVSDDLIVTDNEKFRIEGNQLFIEENPNYEEQNLYQIVVTASDMGGLSTLKSFRIHIAYLNDPVIANGTIPGQTLLAGETFSYSFASDLFTDEDVGDVLYYVVTLSNDTPLPAWLAFDGGTRAFSGSPVNSDAGTMQVKVTASDGNGSAASVTFDLEVQYNTALNEIEEDGFKLYPNPATDLLMLEFAQRYGGQILRIYNCVGVLENEFMLQSSGRTSISIADLPAGIYFLRIGDTGKHTRKFRVK
jgi:hypothetical protein